MVVYFGFSLLPPGLFDVVEQSSQSPLDKIVHKGCGGPIDRLSSTTIDEGRSLLNPDWPFLG